MTKNKYNFIFQNPFLKKKKKYKKLYIDGLNQFEQARLNQIVKEKLGDWTPDIIISQGWEVCSKILQNLYPKTLCLNQENAFSSRPPFPRALAYDYDGPFFNFMTRFPKQVKAFKISKADDFLINQFKSELQRILIDNSVYPPELMQFKKKFKKLILFPLVSTYHDSFFPNLPYSNDFDLLEFVFSKVPSDIGVVVSEHPAGGILSDETLMYFQKKYPNFMKGTGLSINYFPYVDAVLNTTSKTGLFSLLWDIPLISLAPKINDFLYDIDNLDDINKLWKMPIKNKNNILCWYFTHYTIFIKDFSKENFLYSFLEDSITRFKKEGITFNFYNKINDLEEILNYIISSVVSFYHPQDTAPLPVVKKQKKDNLGEKIFSIKNSFNKKHKIINFLGLKVKIKRKK